MSKKRIVWICLLIEIIFFSDLRAVDFLAEAKAAYFAPTNHRFQKIYSNGGIYGAEITCQVDRNFYGWISADYFTKEGSSMGKHDSTRITVVPLGAGLKYLFPTHYADLYLGAGVLGTYVQMRDHSPFVIHHISKWGLGGIAKGGVIFKWSEQLFADLFTSYTYTKIDFHHTDEGKVTRQSAPLSGWSFGLGIGYRFGSCAK